jgi:hypothetical protein
MEYNIDEKKYKIEIKGSKREIKKFARCLVEIVDRNKISELEYFTNKKDPFIFDINQLNRIYFNNTSLVYMPNGISDTHFSIIKKHYEIAREKFEKL